MNKIPIDWQRVAKWSAALSELNDSTYRQRLFMESAHKADPHWPAVKLWLNMHHDQTVRLTAARKAYEEAIRL